MRKFYLSLVLLFSASTLAAQTTREEIARRPDLAGGTYCSYYGGKAKLTPAPEGYEPFYISHYGRHGSRYMTSNNAYHVLIPLFEKAEKEGVLTRFGVQTLAKLRRAYANATGKSGELTALGGRQHEGIAKRMFERFPEVFTRDARIHASSTMVHRCQESMQFFCGELKHLNHDIYVMQRTTVEDTTFMNHESIKLARGSNSRFIESRIRHICDSLYRTVAISHKFFTDRAFAARNLKDTIQLADCFYNIAEDMQCLPELKLKFDGIFSDEDLFNLLQVTNYGWVDYDGFIEGDTPNYKCNYNLLRDIITKADKAIRGGSRGADLRFGHDSFVVPLCFILRLNNSVKQPDAVHLEDLYKYYLISKVSPMAANIQLVFYKKQGSKDVLVKILHNETEQSIPVKTDRFPYYHWEDVKAFYVAEMARAGVKGLQ